jgi:predicted RNA-binding protein with PIN domain
MPLMIDGYNLLHASGILPRRVGPGGLERSRTALLNFLVETLPDKERAATTVVFDAGKPPVLVPRSLVHHGITVRFAVDYTSADELMEELIAKCPTPKRLTVVSSDHRLHRAAKRRKATPIDSDVWHRQIVRERMARLTKTQTEETKPDGPLSDVEVQFWLKHFSEPTKKRP